MSHGTTTAFGFVYLDAEDMELKAIMASDGRVDDKSVTVGHDNFKKYLENGNVMVLIASNNRDCQDALQNILEKHEVLPQNFVGLVNAFKGTLEPHLCSSFVIGVLDSIRPYVTAMPFGLEMDRTTSGVMGGAGSGCDYALKALSYRSSRVAEKFEVRRQPFGSDPTNPVQEVPIVSGSEALKWVHEAMVYAAGLDDEMGGGFYDVFCGKLDDDEGASWEHQRFAFEEMKCSFPECYFDYLAIGNGAC